MKLLSHPGAGWSIRRARASDRLDIEAVFLRCLADFEWRATPRMELLRMRRTILACDVIVAEEAGAGLIGFASVEIHNAYIPHLFVDADWRLCGVGSGLLEVSRDLAGQPLRLDVDTENIAAQAAYLAMGWTVASPAGGRQGDQIRLIGP